MCVCVCEREREVRVRVRVGLGDKISFGQYKSNRSLWKVPTIHRNKCVCVCVCVAGGRAGAVA